MQDGGHDAFQKPEDTTNISVFTLVCTVDQLRFDIVFGALIKVATKVKKHQQESVESGVFKTPTIRVDAVERSWRDDGHFTLTQRTLRGQLLLTA